MFRSLIHFEVIFHIWCEVGVWIHFLLIRTYLFQHHFKKYLCFIHWITSPSLSKINWHIWVSLFLHSLVCFSDLYDLFSTLSWFLELYIKSWNQVEQSIDFAFHFPYCLDYSRFFAFLYKFQNQHINFFKKMLRFCLRLHWLYSSIYWDLTP